jgi:hypothetical protein
MADSRLQRPKRIVLVQSRRLLRFARNDNISKIKPLVLLRGVPPLRDDAAISILDLCNITKLKSNSDKTENDF